MMSGLAAERGAIEKKPQPGVSATPVLPLGVTSSGSPAGDACLTRKNSISRSVAVSHASSSMLCTIDPAGSRTQARMGQVANLPTPLGGVYDHVQELLSGSNSDAPIT